MKKSFEEVWEKIVNHNTLLAFIILLIVSIVIVSLSSFITYIYFENTVYTSKTEKNSNELIRKTPKETNEIPKEINNNSLFLTSDGNLIIIGEKE